MDSLSIADADGMPELPSPPPCLARARLPATPRAGLGGEASRLPGAADAVASDWRRGRLALHLDSECSAGNYSLCQRRAVCGPKVN